MSPRTVRHDRHRHHRVGHPDRRPVARRGVGPPQLAAVAAGGPVAGALAGGRPARRAARLDVPHAVAGE
ncbi:hypothetical protein [Streptomyces sp. V1I6]|uniref:hypothetical protein n=1 Tax=Streptomyces sp. V1I6 TaxID=3042273 RepID=UPI00277DB5FC|nr:hypothetical protein [Streptomyces sp. V1I6]MDQ0841167.1 hypothetical protein [Streptomyces sp. V1I6]